MYRRIYRICDFYMQQLNQLEICVVFKKTRAVEECGRRCIMNCCWRFTLCHVDLVVPIWHDIGVSCKYCSAVSMETNNDETKQYVLQKYRLPKARIFMGKQQVVHNVSFTTIEEKGLSFCVEKQFEPDKFIFRTLMLTMMQYRQLLAFVDLQRSTQYVMPYSVMWNWCCAR